jgi:OmpA-OmpF porin, OOP family
MKKFTLLFLCSFGLSVVQAQVHSVLSYHFEGTLAEAKGVGPTLIVLDSVGHFVMDTLDEVNGRTKTVYRFARNSGLQFNNRTADHFIDSTYTIELYFVFDELSGWKRVTDWKHRTTDYGAYVYYGELNFYPYVYSQSAPVLPGEYTYYVITRDRVTKSLKIYTDAMTEINFTDTYDDAVMDTAQVLNFFLDDLVVPNESSAGAVALLNIYNYVLDSTAIKHNFDSLHNEIFSVREQDPRPASAWVYPNPAADFVNISLNQFLPGEQVEVTFINSDGKEVYHRSFPSGSSYRVDLNSLSLPEGIYLVRAVSSKESYCQKFILRK